MVMLSGEAKIDGSLVSRLWVSSHLENTRLMVGTIVNSDEVGAVYYLYRTEPHDDYAARP